MPRPKSRRHNSSPVSRRKHSVSSDFLPPCSTWEVTNNRSPYTTGELVPHPGNLTDQRTFSVWLQCVARLRPSATPSPFGPLHPGHSPVRLALRVFTSPGRVGRSWDSSGGSGPHGDEEVAKASNIGRGASFIRSTGAPF